MKKIITAFIGFLTFFLFTGTVLAYSLTVGNDSTLRTTTDTRANFVVVDTNNPADHDGQLDRFEYYATTNKPFRFLVVDDTFVVTWVSEEVTPTYVPGVNNFEPAVNAPVKTNWNVGLYYPQTGTIPFNYGVLAKRAYFTYGGWGMPYDGQQLNFQNLPQGRVYSYVAYYDNDLDDDGVLNESDRCPNTSEDSFWGVAWGTNRWQLESDYIWYQNGKKEKKTGEPISYTYGCSGHQILTMLQEELGDVMKGHWKYGLSSSVLEDFHMDLNDGVLDGRYLLESVAVDSSKTTNLSSLSYNLGLNLYLESQGMYSYGPAMADTEWQMRSGNWISGDLVMGEWHHGLDVVINDEGFDWLGGPYAGPSATNVYTLNYTTTADGYLNFKVLDDIYGDNVGSLTVKIYADIP